MVPGLYTLRNHGLLQVEGKYGCILRGVGGRMDCKKPENLNDANRTCTSSRPEPQIDHH
ncbi:uncharacterized protein LACBIDRAFT_312163 [Laccaria bicolor S238N-H82]|uniref:Predicted protein n=1 Tax=Laccaria bicolor (strain S238N-H82 / ATCC MYA-4686) TaxID=486041 RepID=B0D833_LACBS|nr:uncharacterized protein LACBIDRAFT_296688 [Laccaria bicolor S238N-H82]XP_001888034.1 uncharacterized protein LACBIDRAFT_312163 [Laccaria bicolor S238N-H82]EDR01327.1 predicted protein [Laccaria bicolor S238N-H82]EDR09241.1 predicted protein [Laccaria bicolor S238N-H82]|eukprot:XP_001880554.1 predicted protein [Laccaria bicolor S238N-H82]